MKPFKKTKLPYSFENTLKKADLQLLTELEASQYTGGWNTKKAIWWGIFVLSIVSVAAIQNFYNRMQYSDPNIPDLKKSVENLTYDIKGPLGLEKFIIPAAERTQEDVQGFHETFIKDKASCTENMIAATTDLVSGTQNKLLELNALLVSKKSELKLGKKRLSDAIKKENEVCKTLEKKYKVPYLASLLTSLGGSAYVLLASQN